MLRNARFRAGGLARKPLLRTAFPAIGRPNRSGFRSLDIIVEEGLAQVASDFSGVSGIAARYATALYDLAEEAKALDTVAGDLRDVAAMIEASDDLRRLIRSPLFRREEQTRAIAALMEKAGVSDLTRRFVGVVAGNRRLFALPAMVDAFLRILAARRGEVAVEVTSARPLTEEQVQALVAALKRKVGDKIGIALKVDPALIGGLVVRVGSRMIDSSLRTKLQRLQLAMKGVG